MSADRIDHAAEATRLLSDIPTGMGNGDLPTPAHASAGYAAAQVHATLAVAQQLRVANLIALGDVSWTDAVVPDRDAALAVIREGLGL